MPLQRDAIIELDDVCKSFSGRCVLKDVNLKVYRNDFVAITGPNGGGKTTLLRILLKLTKPDSGNVSYLSEGEKVKRLHIGYLPQKSEIDTRFPITVEEVVRSGLLKGFIGRGNSQDDNRRFRKTVELTGIGDYLDKPIFGLSGGQLQRTLFGRALVSDPAVLVLDEPLSYVDKEFEHQIYSMMEDLSARTTIILVSHKMSVISGMATRHIIVNDCSVHECSAHHHYIADECR